MSSLLELLGSAAFAFPLNMRFHTIRAGLPGTHTIPGIKPGDIIVTARQRPRTVHTTIAGGLAGSLVLGGINLADRLVQVYEEDGTSGIKADLTSNFFISGNNEISNFVDDTSGNLLVIVYERDGLDFAADVTITAENEITTVTTPQASGTQWEIAWVDVT